jgi:PAS domain S-box-containing protein
MDSGSVEEKNHEVATIEAVGSSYRPNAGERSHSIEAMYRVLFEAIDQGMSIAEVILNDVGEGVDCRILEANSKFEELTGKSREQLLSGKTMRELIPILEESWFRFEGTVAVTGESRRFENYAAALDKWIEVYAFRVGDPSLHRVACVYTDVTTRRRSEQALRNSEKVQKYLLRLSDVLRPVADPVEIMRTGPEHLARELDLSVAGYVEMSADGDSMVIGAQYADGRMPELKGACKFSDFGDGFAPALGAGEEIFISDVYEDLRGPKGGSEKTRAFKIRSVAGIPQIKNGRLVAFFYASHFETRPWLEWEREIVRQTAERTWAAVERARAETAQRSSDERYRTLFNSIDQGIAVVEVLYDQKGAANDLRFLEANCVWEKQNGVVNPVGRTTSEVLPFLELECVQRYARVVETGESTRFECHVESLGLWLDISASLVGVLGSRVVSIVFNDITERKRTEEAQRASEEKQAYLLRLSDALRPLTNPIEIQGTASRMLGEELKTDCTLYSEIDEELGELYVARAYVRGDAKSPAGRHKIEKFSWIGPTSRMGGPVVVNDVRTTPLIPDADRAPVIENQIRAFVAALLIKDARLVANLCTTSRNPRAWTDIEIDLVQETADRTWAAVERALAEAALSESEAKYRTLFDSIDQAYSLIEVLYDASGCANDFLVISTNRIFEKHLGLANLAGKTAREAVPGIEESWIQAYARVAETGEVLRFENYSGPLDRWFNVYASRVGGAGSRLVNVVFDDITLRKQAEAESRSREERHAYKLRLSDALRPLSDPIEIQAMASRLLGEQLSANRIFYGEIDEKAGILSIERDFVREGTPSAAGQHPMEVFAWLRTSPQKFRPAVVNDVQTSEILPESDRAGLAAVQAGAFIGVPLIKDDRLVACLCAMSASARNWTEADVGLVQDTADRTWGAVELARAEAAQRASEEKYRTLFNLIDQSVLAIEVLYDENGRADNLRFIETNPVFEKVLGRSDVAGKTSRELLPDLEDECIQTYAEVARTGESVRFEHHELDGRWLDIFAARLGGPGSNMVSVVFDDITDRKHSEEALRASEEKYRSLFDSIDQGYAMIEVLYDAEGAAADVQFVNGNRVFEKQTGLKDYIGKKRRELVPTLEDSWVQMYARVAETGEPVRFENYSAGLGRWFDVFASRVGGAGSRLVNVVFDDITERKQSEAALRTSEERQAYKWTLSDAIRSLSDPIEIQGTASQILGRYLGADRVFYGVIDEESGQLLIERDYVREGTKGLVGRYPLEVFAWIRTLPEKSTPAVVSDVRTTPLLPEADRVAITAVNVEAFIAVPLIKDGRLVATFCVTDCKPRKWTSDDLETVWHTAERTWAAVARAKAERALSESEERYRTLFDSIDQGYALLEVQYDADGAAQDLYFVETNRVFEKQTGMTNYAGKTARQVNPELEDRWVHAYARVVETGDSARFDTYVKEIDRWFTVAASKVGGDESRLVSVVFDDISERKRHEEALRESEERQAYLLKLSDAMRPLSDPVEVQGTASRILGEHLRADRTLYAEIDAQGDVLIARDHLRDGAPSLVGRFPMEAVAWIRPTARLSRPTVVDDVKTAPFIPDKVRGTILDASVGAFVAVPLLKDGHLVAALCVCELAARKWSPTEVKLVQETAERTWHAVLRAKAEAALSASEQRMQRVLETETIGVLFLDGTGTVVHANEVFLRMTGYTHEDVKRRALNWRLLTPPEYVDETERQMRRVAETGRIGPYEKEYVVKDGSRRWLLFTGRDLGDGTISEYCVDITDRKLAETALRESEERFRLFMENVHEYAFMQCDRELRITSWNPGAERIFGYSAREALGRSFSFLLTPEDLESGVPCMTISNLESAGRNEDARWLLRKDGHRIWTRWVSEPVYDKDGKVTGLTKVLRDETERLKAETSLRQSEKLAVVGRMASSIAHEINNPLEAVTNLIYLARRGVVSPEVGEFLAQAEIELARVSHMTTATLHFHRQTTEPHEVDIEEVVESVLTLHEGRLKSMQVATERRYGWHPVIFCQANEIRQVIANLVSNAIDAMTKNVDARQLIVRLRKAADPVTGEEGIRVMISDTGVGIRESAQKRVFEPFFTTKAATGTGLGLWLSDETIKKHKGTLRFRTRTDGKYRGTVFSMFLRSTV